MWICASCGTQAQQPDVCSGCGTVMRPFNQPQEKRYMFVIVGHRTPEGCMAVYGPFESVTQADQWWDKHMSEVQGYTHGDYEVVLMENPNDRET